MSVQIVRIESEKQWQKMREEKINRWKDINLSQYENITDIFITNESGKKYHYDFINNKWRKLHEFGHWGYFEGDTNEKIRHIYLDNNPKLIKSIEVITTSKTYNIGIN